VGGKAVSRILTELANERSDIELRLGDPRVSDAELVSMLHRPAQLRFRP
jgi:hypothetical protein